MMMSSIMMLLLVLLGVAMGQVASNWDCMTSAKVNGVAIFKWNYASGGKTRSSTIWKFTPTGGTAGNIMIKSSNDDTPANVDPSYGSRLREICPTSTCPSGNNIGMVLSNLSAVDIGTYAVTVNFDDATSTEISQPLNVVDTATEPTDEFTIKQCGQVCENNICVNITDFKCEPKDNPYTLIVDLEDAKIETPVITILINGDTREECGNTLYCSYNADSTDCFVIEVMTADGSTLLFPETEPTTPIDHETSTSPPDTSDPTQSSTEEPKKGLSDGAIAGIVVGCVAAVVIIIIIVVCCRKKKKKKHPPRCITQQPSNDTSTMPQYGRARGVPPEQVNPYASPDPCCRLPQPNATTIPVVYDAKDSSQNINVNPQRIGYDNPTYNGRMEPPPDYDERSRYVTGPQHVSSVHVR